MYGGLVACKSLRLSLNRLLWQNKRVVILQGLFLGGCTTYFDPAVHTTLDEHSTLQVCHCVISILICKTPIYRAQIPNHLSNHTSSWKIQKLLWP